MKHKWFTRLPLIRFNHYTQFSLLSSLSSSCTPSIPVTVSKHKILCTSIKKTHHVWLNGSFTRTFCDNNSDDYYNNVVYEELTVEKFKSIIKTKQDEKKVEEILSSYECLKFETGEIPSTIKPNRMKEFLQTPPDLWANLFRYLAQKESFNHSKKLTKSSHTKSESYNSLQQIVDAGRVPVMGLKFDPKTGAPIYGEWLNSHFVRLRRQEYRNSFTTNLLVSFLFGQKLVIDLDYDYSIFDAKIVAHDLKYAFAINRTSADPFNLTLTGLNNELLKELLDEHITSINASDGLLCMSTHSENFTELLANEKLIYLSPDSKNLLLEYDDDATYILGGLSPRVSAPHSYKKAIASKLTNFCLPLSFLPFRAMRSAKSLNVSECVKIMLRFKDTRDIKEACQHGISPSRLKTIEELEQEQRVRYKKLAGKKSNKINPTFS